MKITEMSKQDFASVQYLDTYRDWKKLAPNGRFEFDSLVIIPVENEDGTINIPEALRPYMGGKEKIYPTAQFEVATNEK